MMKKYKAKCGGKKNGGEVVIMENFTEESMLHPGITKESNYQLSEFRRKREKLAYTQEIGQNVYLQCVVGANIEKGEVDERNCHR